MTLTGGRTTSFRGGGAVATTFGNVSLINSAVSGNSTSGNSSSGGGIATRSGNVSLTDSAVTGNISSVFRSGGGGIATSTGNVALNNSTVSQNSAGPEGGGGIRAGQGNISLINSTVSENDTVGGSGGGIDAGSGNVSLVDSTLSGNIAIGSIAGFEFQSVGGGINSGSGNVSLINSTLSGNNSAGDGGGIHNDQGNVSVINSTVIGNVAASAAGGGIAVFNYSNASFVTIENSIVAGNIDNGTAPELRFDSSNTVTINHSLIGDTTGTVIDSRTGTGNVLNRSALIGPLADNGGATLTHSLLEGSPAINAGRNALATDEAGNPLTFDQRGGGFERLQFGTIDIGAVESNFNAVIPPTIVSATINEGGVLDRPDLLETLTVVFNTNVSVSANDLTIFNDLPRGIEFDLTGIGFNYDSSTNTAIWDFSSINPLGAGFYSYQLDANSIAVGNVTLDSNGDGVRGDNFEDQIYVAIPGDANLDGRVDVLNDAFTLVSNLITPSGALHADGDFNGDGQVDILGDAFILVANLNRNVDLVSDVVVSNNSDLVNGDTSSIFALIADDGSDGISLREAITASNNTIGSGTITFDGGVFTGGADSLIRLIQGELEVTDGLTIDASAATDVTITGDSNGDDATVSGTFITDAIASFGGTSGDMDDLLDDNSRVLNFTGATGDLTLTNLTLTGGRTTGNNPFAPAPPSEITFSGGAIRFLSNGSLQIESSIVAGNSTSGYSADGGGVYASTGAIYLTNSNVSQNNTSGSFARGGGIFAYSSDVFLSSSSVDGNSATSAGGGIYTFDGNVSLSNSNVDRNDGGSDGGGIYTRSGDVSLSSSAVNANSTASEGARGGGIYTRSGNVVLSNSSVDGNSTAGNDAGGGGIFNRDGIISLTDSTVSGNSTSGEQSNGGGIYTRGDVSLTNSSVDGNSTSGSGASGGGIHTSAYNVSLSNSTVNENSTAGYGAGGGGIFNIRGIISLTDSTVSGNSTSGEQSDGGGIRASGGRLYLTDSTVSGNITSGSQSNGGGIFASGGELYLTDTTVSGNITSGDQSNGGGIYASGGGLYLTGATVSGNITSSTQSVGGGIFAESQNVLLTNSTLSGNSSARGGGISATYGTILLTNSTVSGNDGGGINVSSDNAIVGGSSAIYINSAVTLINSTVTANTATAITIGDLSVGGVGGIHAGAAALRIVNSIVAGNFSNLSTLSPDLRSATGYLVVEHSLIGDTTGSGVTATTGSGNILNQSALLGPLADNGGPTQTHALLSDSLAINSGNNNFAVDAFGVPFTNDQRGSGFDRIQVGAVDIGAFESSFINSQAPVVVSATIDEGGVLARPDLLNTLTVVFNIDVNVSVEALTLINDSPRGVEVDLTGIDFSYDPSTNTAIWDFSSIDPVVAGFYTYQLDANSITNENFILDGNGDGIRGDDLENQLYVAIPGDINLDGRVDVLNDAFALVRNLITPSGAVYADGDLNSDGRVDILGDAFILVANLNRNVDLVTEVIVSNNTDLVNGDTSSFFALINNDGGDGISLREAVIASNNVIGADTLTFDETVFSGGVDSLIRVTQGELEITDTLTIDASSATNVIVTGDANADDISIAGTFITDVGASFGGTAGDADDLLDDNSRVLNFSGEMGDLTLNGLTLTGGRTTEDNAVLTNQGPVETAQNGGGIRFSSNGVLTLVNSAVSGNSTSGVRGVGGGIFSY